MSGWQVANIVFEDEVPGNYVFELNGQEAHQSGTLVSISPKERFRMDELLKEAEKSFGDVHECSECGNEEKYLDFPSNLKHVVLVEANDTTDSGYAVVYKPTEDGLEKVEEIQGYEGANARDVVGEYRDKYGQSIRVHWEY